MAVSWEDQGIVISARRFGEHDAIVSLLTETQGRHVGLVKGGLGRKNRGILQPGNVVRANWRARLEGQLGTYIIEALDSYAALALSDANQLSGITALCAMVDATLPEREPHANIYEGTLQLLKNLNNIHWPAYYALWELALLKDLGYGLDLSSCVVTGRRDNLIYVSPKTGRAVSKGAAGEYASRLFVLPSFFRTDDVEASKQEVAQGLAITGHFFESWVFNPQNQVIPSSRTRFVTRFDS